MFVAKLESYNQSITVSLCSHPSEKIRVKRVKFLEFETTCDRTKWKVLIQLVDNVNTRNAHVQQNETSN